MRPQPSGLVPQQDEQTPDIANLLAGYPLDPTATFGTTPQTASPSLASLPTEIATELGSVVASDPVVQAAGGAAGGVMDIFGRLLNPQTSPFAGKGDQPYSPMFSPESLWGGLGRGIASGFTGGYPEGPIDHQSLSGPEQALYFADIADPSGVGGDILRPLAKAIPEDTLAGLAGIIPSANRKFFQKSKVVDKEGGLKPLFHGTQSEIQEVQSGFGSGGGLYGPGFYMTESSDVASGYSGVSPEIAKRIEETIASERAFAVRRERELLDEIAGFERDIETLKGPDPKFWQAEENQWERASKEDIPWFENRLKEVTSDLKHFRASERRDLSKTIFGAYPGIEGANVNAFYANFEKPFDIDAPVDREMLDPILKMFDNELDREKLVTSLIDTYEGMKYPPDIGTKLEQLITHRYGLTSKELRELTDQVVKTNDELWLLMVSLKWQEIQKPGFTPRRVRLSGGASELVYEDLIGAGYDSITHIGGARTGTSPHKVWIDIDPDKGRTIPWSVAEGAPTERLVPPVRGGSGTIPPQGTGGVLPGGKKRQFTVVESGDPVSGQSRFFEQPDGRITDNLSGKNPKKSWSSYDAMIEELERGGLGLTEDLPLEPGKKFYDVNVILQGRIK